MNMSNYSAMINISISLYEECLNALHISFHNESTTIIPTLLTNMTTIYNDPNTILLTNSLLINDTINNYNYNNIFLNQAMQLCISNRYVYIEQLYNDLNINDYYNWLYIFMGAFTFFMQTGFAMLCAGSVRKKNLINTVLQNLLDTCISLLCYYCIGYAFAFGDNNTDGSTTGYRFIGTTHFFGMGLTNNDYGFWFYQYGLNAISVTIIAGTIAERCQMKAYIMYAFIYCIFVYPIIVHSIWNSYGFLSISASPQLNNVGVIDFAGSGVVHITGGMTALIATSILGPRSGRFTNAKGQLLLKPKHFPGSSIALSALGIFMLWFGWYGFNAGSTLSLIATSKLYLGTIAARTAANTSLAAASGACSALLTNMYYQRELSYSTSTSGGILVNSKYEENYCFSLPMVMNGALSGLVAITASCATVELWAALVVGMISGWIYMFSSQFILYCKLDDVVDGIPVHLFNGIWGMISVGLFTSPSLMLQTYGQNNHVGFFYSLGQNNFDAYLLLNQFVAIMFIISYTTAIMYPFFRYIDYMNWFRPSQVEEVVGLDLQYHGGIIDEAKEEVEEDIAIYQQQQLSIQNTSRHGSNRRASVTSNDINGTSRSSSSGGGKKRRSNKGGNSSVASSTIASIDNFHKNNTSTNKNVLNESDEINDDIDIDNSNNNDDQQQDDITKNNNNNSKSKNIRTSSFGMIPEDIDDDNDKDSDIDMSTPSFAH